MLSRLPVLFAEQQSAADVVIFVLLITAVAMLAGFAGFTLLVWLGWRERLRDRVPLRRVLFPPAERIRRYAGDGLLAMATSVILLFTVAARHEAVNTILAYDLGDLAIGDVERMLPATPVQAEQAAATEDQRRAYFLSLPVNVVLVSILEAGSPAEAEAWLNWSIRRAGLEPWPDFPADIHLLFMAALLLAGYVAWFAATRIAAVAREGAESTADYGLILRRLLVPAVCVALLLVSALDAAQPARTVESAVAAVAANVERGRAPVPATWLVEALDDERRRFRRHATDTLRLARLESRADLTDGSLAALRRDLEAVVARPGDDPDVREPSRTGLLLVLTVPADSYQVTGNGMEIRGGIIGLHALPSGEYLAGTRYDREFVVVNPDEVVKVTLAR